jgi:carbonic anhydrase/acetyltransferase-like protein (isoleucine patch superfamily)
VTDGSRVGRDAIIGAGAVVIGEIPEFAIAVGDAREAPFAIVAPKARARRRSPRRRAPCPGVLSVASCAVSPPSSNVIRRT